MDMTPRWALPLLFAGQAQKEIFHNEALTVIDALLHGRVESADSATPPGAPVAGQCWIVAAGASGAWAGQAGAIACWSAGGWRFLTPRAGMRVDVADRGHALFHDGAEWRDAAIRGDGLYLDGNRLVTTRQAAIADPSGGTVIDVEGRATMAAILTALRAHGLIGS
ncbi:DUF2793 domain-containing protein [Sphingobium sp. HBC34]|uniref:DUF2793 domain-containing protein n=1 Tax=Sphingobium cyanobacteriorum TaxID=3063954 RepID=A0ABT8ZK76_9SPHN|nr:DUF2793 domain-containing protein [Sphingobium sp. HBC34]MDO7834944.1 DUF2793 domain-containing protein [Sphingobium sp. HBC34]